MMLTKSKIILVGAASILILVACNSGSMSGAASTKGGVAATVNGTPISESLVDLMLKQRTDLGRAAGADVRNGYIDRLAMQTIISQEAVNMGLDKQPDVAARLELNRQAALIDAFVQNYLKNNVSSDSVLKAEYEKFKAKAAGTEYMARHILVQKEEDAKEIIAKLNKNPKAFEALAKEKSIDTGTKFKGGELGWFDPGAMIPEFGLAVAKLAKGKFTEEPVKSQFGFHVILLEDSRPKQVQSFDEMKPQLAQQLQQQNLKKLFDEMKAKAKIVVMQVPASEAAPAKEAKPAAEPAKPTVPAKN